MRLGRRSLLAGVGAALLAVGASGYLSTSTEVSTVHVGLGRRILLLTDLHIHGLRELPDLPSYDLALIGGDTYDEWTRDLSAVEELLAGLRGPKAAVLGNHEHWAARRGRVPLREGIAALEGAGVHLLVDDCVYMGGLRICGLDWREDPRDYPAVRDADVVLVHSPDAFRGAVGGLYLAGHTHGGQWCLPGNVPISTNSHYGYAWGLYRSGPAAMYVSRGLGEMLPRAFCDREAVLLD